MLAQSKVVFVKIVHFLMAFFIAHQAFALDFQRACEPARKQIIIGAVGDFLMHRRLQVQAYKQDFKSLWRGVQSRIDQSDIMYGNLETPSANGVTKSRKSNGIFDAKYDDNTYSSYPTFNVHNSLLDDIKASGFDVLSTANNHSMDRGSIGINKTIEALENRQMAFTGTRKSNTSTSYTAYVNYSFLKVAFISCTFSLNGFTDNSDQVLECFSEKSKLLSEIEKAKTQSDAVIVTPHWGIEYQHSPEARDKQLAKDILEAGALAVIGTHPHVIQPMERYITRDGRETAIVYSTGNFVSNQQGIKKLGLMVFLGLSSDGQSTWINGLRYSPTYFINEFQGLQFLEDIKQSDQFMPTVHKVMKDPKGLLSSREKLRTEPQCQ